MLHRVLFAANYHVFCCEWDSVHMAVGHILTVSFFALEMLGWQLRFLGFSGRQCFCLFLGRLLTHVFAHLLVRCSHVRNNVLVVR